MNTVIDWMKGALSGEVLIASDLDGTLTPIVARPEDTRLDGRARSALARLARAARTHVAVLSGRTLADVAGHVADITPMWIAGDHGMVVVDPERRARLFDDFKPEPRLAELQRSAEELARVFAGARVEVKTRSVALHYRAVAADKHEAIVEMFRVSCAAHRAKPMAGRMVIEGRCGEGDKGLALRYIMSRLPAGTSVVYVGDDVTDEPALAYAHSHPRGLALHVVSDERVAPQTPVHGLLAGPEEWLEILEAFTELRGRAEPSCRAY